MVCSRYLFLRTPHLLTLITKRSVHHSVRKKPVQQKPGLHPKPESSLYQAILAQDVNMADTKVEETTAEVGSKDETGLQKDIAGLSVTEKAESETSLKSSASASSFKDLQFQAPYGLGGPTRQTVMGGLMKKTDYNISCRRVRYETTDDDFLDVDYFDCKDNPWDTLGDAAPIVLLIHGLGGSARSGYVREMARNLARRGIRSAGMNCRGSSGEPNRQARLYYAADIYDPGFILECVMKEYPQAPVGLCGFSLGASQTLNYMCLRAKDYPDRLKLAVAISPPLYLDKGIDAMETPAGKKWNNYLLSGLKTLIKPLEPVLREKSTIDMDRVYGAKSIREFDAAFTVPLHGFESTAQYYTKCSSGPLLGQIERSTLVIRSGDDPFLAPADVECPHLRTNPHITALLTSQGGHVGFIERQGLQLLPWAERVAADWCAAVFGIADETAGEMEL